jgi:hypothetical protein
MGESRAGRAEPDPKSRRGGEQCSTRDVDGPPDVGEKVLVRHLLALVKEQHREQPPESARRERKLDTIAAYPDRPKHIERHRAHSRITP